MRLARVLPPLVAKEVRALLPIWLGCLLIIAVCATAGDALFRNLGRPFGVLTYLAGSIVLGALAIGQEYQHRTLPMLLSQPVSRGRILGVKFVVLAAMLLTLAAAAWRGVFYTSGETGAVVLLAIFFGLFVAPWLTMWCRNPLGGSVFAVALPGVVVLLVQGLIAEMLSLAAFVRLMAGISGVAAVLSWRMFMRLEAIEGRGQDLSLPMTRADLAPGRRGRPLWRLARKELGLQQLSFAVAGVATMGWLAMFLFGVVTSTSRQFEDPLGAVASLDSGLLALVIGSLASAEERQLGVFEWQALLPIASWKQWAVKVAVTLGLALLLSVLLPALLLAFTGGPIRIGQRYAGVMLVLTTASLYVSSLSSSGVRALIVSLPISLFALFITVTLLMRPGGIQLTPISTGFVGAVLGLGLYFALVNHRSAERGTRRILLQVLCLTGCAVLSVVLVAVGIR